MQTQNIAAIELMTPQDLMKILKVSRSTAYEIMEKPDFPLIRIGRNKRVIATEFTEWLQKQKQSNTVKNPFDLFSKDPFNFS